MSASAKRSVNPATRAIAILAATAIVILGAATLLAMRGHGSAAATSSPTPSPQSVHAQVARTEAQWEQRHKLRPLGLSKKAVTTAAVSVSL